MTYLMITQNQDYFMTLDDPEKVYKWEIIFGSWKAFRLISGIAVDRLIWMGSESRFVWVKIEYLNLP